MRYIILQMCNNFTPVRDVEDAVPYKWGHCFLLIFNVVTEQGGGVVGRPYGGSA